MSDSNKEELQARIDRLERKVEELERRLEAGRPFSGEKRREEQKRRWKTEEVNLGEQWLNRIGIGLLLVGVAFLFKYSIDQGWLIPPVRSAIGLGIGVALFATGLQMKPKFTPLKQILLGGGIAVFYITGFATFQFYTFVSPAIVWSFMVVVTLLALSLSLQQDEPVLSVVGTLGALGTPFMLYTGSGSVVMLMVYTVLVLAGAMIVYLQKGWRSLLWSMSLGGALVIFVGIVNTTYDNEPAVSAEYWALQIGAIIWMLGAWVLPVAREVLSQKDLSRWPEPDALPPEGKIPERVKNIVGSTVHLMVFLVPLLMLVMTIANWELSLNRASIVSFALAAAGGLFYRPLVRQGLQKLAYTHGFMGLTMATIAVVLLLEGNFLFIVLAAEAVALRFIAWQTDDARISVSSHMLFGIVFLWLLNTLYASIGDKTTVIATESLTQLTVIVAGGILIPRWIQRFDIRQVYQITTHLVFLLWLYQTFSVMGNGQAWVTVSWGIYAIALLVMGFVWYNKNVRVIGMATIFVVVGKLFFVDLSQLEAIWRILMFMGFGVVFLLLGYYWQSKWSDEDSETELSKN